MSTPAWVTCRVPHHDAPGLGDLVAEPAAFLAGELFRRPLWTSARLLPRSPCAFPTAEALWSDALTRHVRTPAFRLVQDGTTLAPSSYCRPAGVGQRTIDDVIEPNRVLELHRAGATMVLQGLQLTDPALGRCATNLALALDHPVQVNAYLSPEAACGLDVHFDYHDVFVVQLDGCKRWRVWEPLARTRQPVRAVAPVTMPTLDELGAPSLDLTMRAGDCLYLPRGFPHAAETIESASAHLTIGVMAVTWQRVVRHALDAAVGAGHLRASVPARALDSGA
ncbi:MAG: cupin, partial [Acidimicrobiia bacterium]|nr:cupin [Acidimicrobiia bacterium]